MSQLSEQSRILDPDLNRQVMVHNPHPGTIMVKWLPYSLFSSQISNQMKHSVSHLSFPKHVLLHPELLLLWGAVWYNLSDSKMLNCSFRAETTSCVTRCICLCRHSRCADLLHSGWVEAGGGAAGVHLQQQEVQRADPAACWSSVCQSCGCVQVPTHLTLVHYMFLLPVSSHTS